MNPRRVAALLLAALSALLVSLPCLPTPLRAQPPADPTRGITVRTPGTPLTPGKRWAVIVGINYEEFAQKKAVLGKLTNAENDARLFHKALAEEFGYDDSTTFLLLGSGEGEKLATKVNLEKVLKDVLANPEKVKKEDSILFFFAGHGRRRADVVKTGYLGEIIPAGAELTDEGLPKLSSVIDLEDLRQQLERSPARHKLLILDCCHAGQLFNLPVQPSRVSQQADEQTRFENPCFWGAASCRPAEEASDRGRLSAHNSPFTAVLVRALDTLSGYDCNVKFTARELFEKVKLDFDSEGIGSQRPVAGPLTADAGDFFFWPRAQPEKRRAARGVDSAAATLPGGNGNWWFDDTPWLIPSLRENIVRVLKARSATLTATDKDRLKWAAGEFVKSEGARYEKEGFTFKPGTDMGSAKPDPIKLQSVQRLLHLQKLLELKQAKNRALVLAGIAVELERMEKPRAADLHLLAVIRHRLAREESPADVRPSATPEDPRSQRTVERYYADALLAYQKEQGDEKAGIDPMHALCLSDLGMYNLQLARHDQAALNFLEARTLLPPDQRPVQFAVYTLCKEAEAHRSVGNWDAANKRLRTALDAAKKAEDEGALVAFVHEHQGWSSITEWKSKEAEHHFRQAYRIRQRAPLNDLDSRVLLLHDLHGIAMTSRFQGYGDEAVQQYSQLIRQIREAIEAFEQDGDSFVNAGNFRLGRERLYGRLVNSMERLGDCLLFKDDPDPAEAARFYNKARASRHLMPSEDAELTRLRLGLKIALCASQLPEGGERAHALTRVQRAEEELNRCLDEQLMTREQVSSLAILIPITQQVVKLCTGERVEPRKEGTIEPPPPDAKTPARPAETARDRLIEFIDAQLNDRDRRNRLQRDDIELMLFAAKALVADARQHLKGPLTPGRRNPLEKPALVLVKLCWLVQENSTEDTLGYLRPYYDVIIAAWLEARPGDVKLILDLTAHAQVGKAFDEVVTEPTLVYYFPKKGPGYLFLDVPRGTSRAFPLNDSVLRAWEEKRSLQLPEELVRELKQFSRVQVVWKDNYHKFEEKHMALFDLSRQRFPNLEEVTHRGFETRDIGAREKP
jgi:tetratricopeptide (TPR) repeat protein